MFSKAYHDQARAAFIPPYVKIKSTLDRDEDFPQLEKEPNVALTHHERVREKRRRRFWFGK